MNYLSLFSGIGGFECGINQSKYGGKLECIGYSEIDKFADSIYSRHFPKHYNLGDATRIDTRELDDFDLLVGGFPCQAFSIAGKRKGFQDCRGTLFFEIARILADKRPKYLLLENVKGLLSHQNGETFATILKVLDQLGYNVVWEIYNSKEFVPQSRERLFIKGYFRERCRGEILSFRRTMQETNERIIELNNKKQAQMVTTNVPILKIRTNTTKSYDEVSVGDGIRLCHLNSKTARGRTQKRKVGSLTTETDWGVLDTNYKIRRLTPIECERLQGFKDGWTEFGKDGELISDSQRYKVLGNAVTVNVVKHIFDNWELVED